MTFWLLLILLSAIAFVALIFSGRKQEVFAQSNDELEKTHSHFKSQLTGIDTDEKTGRLAPKEAEAARAELARELVRHRQTLSQIEKTVEKKWLGPVLALTSVLVIASSVGVYFQLGTPDPSVLVPINQVAQLTPEQRAEQENFARLLEQVEAQMLEDPSDVNGWSVLAPAYIRAGRYQDGVNAYRQILDLTPPTADARTDLAEALLLMDGAEASNEVMALLASAAQSDPTHARSRFYLAAEATRLGQWDEAIAVWNELLGLANGDEPWIATAQNGLAMATARGITPEPTQPSAPADPEQAEFIATMVAGLDERLNDEGGSIEEWTRLVQSYIVLGDLEKAQQNYQNAVTAFPEAADRLELDVLAAQSSLSASGQ